MTDPRDEEIRRRTERGKQLAKRYPDLKGLGYPAFLNRILDELPDMDFITSSEMYDALNKEA